MACADSWKNDPWVTYDPWSKGDSGQQNADSSDPQLVHKLYSFLIQKPSEFSKRERMFVAQQGKQINGLTLDAQSVKEALALARAEIPKLLQEQPSQDKWQDTWEAPEGQNESWDWDDKSSWQDDSNDWKKGWQRQGSKSDTRDDSTGRKADPELVHKLYSFLIQKPEEFSKREKMFVAQEGKEINGLTLDSQSVKEALALARAEVPKLLAQEQPSQDKWQDTWEAPECQNESWDWDDKSLKKDNSNNGKKGSKGQDDSNSWKTKSQGQDISNGWKKGAQGQDDSNSWNKGMQGQDDSNSWKKGTQGQDDSNSWKKGTQGQDDYNSWKKGTQEQDDSNDWKKGWKKGLQGQDNSNGWKKESQEQDKSNDNAWQGDSWQKPSSGVWQ